MKLVKLTNDTVKYLNQLIYVRDLVAEEKYSRGFILNPNNHAYFAMIEEKVIGFVWGYTLERLDSEPMMYIHSVDVLGEYRNKGVGKKIVSKFIEIANKSNYRNTFLITDRDSIPANKVYSALGGEIYPKKNLYIFKK
jgi:ribosomal protein S18 acetylase RimI-like enzyme